MNLGMINRRSSIVVLSAVLILLSTLAAGCGGGGQNSRQDSSKDKASQQQESKKAKKKKNAPKARIALGTIVFHNPDTQRFTLRPNEGENRIFRYNKNTKITLGGKKAGPKDIKQGQQAQATYIVKDDLSRVRELELVGKPGSGEETTS